MFGFGKKKRQPTEEAAAAINDLLALNHHSQGLVVHEMAISDRYFVATLREPPDVIEGQFVTVRDDEMCAEDLIDRHQAGTR